MASTKTSVIRGPQPASIATRAVARTMTTGTQIATLPKGARLIGIIIEGTASNAGTTATLSFGTNATSNQWVSAFDVKTVATGDGPAFAKFVAGIGGSVLTADTPVFALYAESGTASSAGAWNVSIMYTTGNIVNNTTL